MQLVPRIREHILRIINILSSELPGPPKHIFPFFEIRMIIFPLKKKALTHDTPRGEEFQILVKVTFVIILIVHFYYRLHNFMIIFDCLKPITKKKFYIH
jgi:hypothetical protein